MSECAKCGERLPPEDPRPSVRSGGAAYHVGCAPPELVASAWEEYRAILRKGVRYFVEKYAVGEAAEADLGATFLELGRALDSERERRARG